MTALRYGILLCCFLVVNIRAFAQSDRVLWYKQAAQHFEESLPLGNGKMGACVFGGVEMDKIYLNDATLWSGEPVNARMNPDAHKYVPAIREALSKENYPLADSLQKHLQGAFSQSFAPLGTLSLECNHKGVAQNYYRELDISKALAITRYEVEGVTFTREYFISHPDQVMVIRLTSSKKGALNVALHFSSLLKYAASAQGSTLSVHGYAPYHAEPSYRGNMPNAVRFDENRGTRFSSLFAVKQTDGMVQASDSTLTISDAGQIVLLVSIATSFNGFDKNPATQGLNSRVLAQQQLDKSLGLSYQNLLKKHLNDYQSFFSRVDLQLGKTTATNLPTDERLRRYATGAEDKNLEILYFQYGRYLLIASSRTQGAPANLQGIWNPYLRPPWSSNYTININAEENYWLAENANLSEMHLPLLSFIENIAVTGKVTAQTFFGTGGWAACHNSDIWAMSNPVGDFGKGDPVWANWYMGGAWLSTHLWEHYLFTGDIQFLKTKGYPLMKGAAQFCLEWLVEDKNGQLITSPATSPENVYLTPDGYKGATLYGGTADLAMIRECFEQTIQAAKIVDADAAFRLSLEQALARLRPYQTGKRGQLLEWYHDWDDAEPQHRHQSHLFGLHPGHQINPMRTPELAAAARRSLEIKGDETTGWSKGWRINLWARLWDGNRAYKMYRELLHYVEPDGVATNYARGGGTYPNLFDAHPPFQIDGNFGGAAAVVEMLLQSGANGEIRLLPALPDAWANGKVKGICARGGYEITMQWENNKLVRSSITAKIGGKCILIYGNQQKTLVLAKGQIKSVKW